MGTLSKIAFCDDDPLVLEELAGRVEQYAKTKNRKMEYAEYKSPVELLAAMESGEVSYDIIFLDILLPGENGIETAREIRKCNKIVKIIFLTSSPEFAVQSYTVGAYYYLLKPIEEDSFIRILDTALLECQKSEEDSLILKCKSGITRVRLADLEYCEVIGRLLFLHMSNGQVLESSGKLDDLSGQLFSTGTFLRPHRSYLVNMDYIQSISYRSITLFSLAEIPIPRGKYTQLKAQYLEYAFRERR